MNEDEQIFRGFSCPQLGLDTSFLELIATGHAQQTTELFLERYAEHLEHSGNGIVQLLTHWLSGETTFDTVWDLAFGDVHSALFINEATDVCRRAARAGLRLHECGLEGDWNLSLPAPAVLHFGRWLLPAADEIEVSAKAQSVSIRTRSDNVWQNRLFQRTNDGWGGWQTSDADALPALSYAGTKCTVLTAEVLNTPEFMNVYSEVDRETAGLLASRCDEAMKLIEGVADFYVPWVNRVLRHLVPLQAKEGVFTAGGTSHSPGVIRTMNVDHCFTLADTLVHESTHQYLYILNRLGPLDDGTDTNLYFSPFRNMGRPVYFMVVSYHAFGNVLLFYRLARASGIPASEFVLSNEEQLMQKLEVLEQALHTTKALTPLGRALWEPLYDQIHC